MKSTAMGDPRVIHPDGRRSWSLPLLLIGVFFAPYRTGRQLAGRSVALALLVQALVLTSLIVGLLVFALSQRSVGNDLRNILESLVSIASMGRLAATVKTVLTVLLGGLIGYWALCICVLTPWMAVEAPQRRQVAYGLVLGGFASMWWIPLTALLLAYSVWVRDARGYMLNNLLLWIFVSLPAVALLCVLMALRLAHGYGDALRRRVETESLICEHCGYDLRATPFEARCPECGQSAAESLSGVHRMNEWECGLRGYAWTIGTILLRPDDFFRSIRARGGLDAARGFFWLSCLASFVVLMILLIVDSAIFPPRSFAQAPAINAWTFGRAAAIVVGWLYAVIGLPLLLAVLVSNALRRLQCPHAASAALKIACYLGGFAVPAAVVLGLIDTVVNFQRRLGLSYDDISTQIRLPAIVLVSGLSAWLWMVGRRGVKWLRWANT